MKSSAQRKYIVRNWIIGLALPIALSTVVLGVADFDVWSELLTLRFMFIVGLTVLTAVAAAWLIGKFAYRKDRLSGDE
jgi:lysylphosphatidylglycerol synthetase-like protein (DUF2156 family)